MDELLLPAVALGAIVGFLLGFFGGGGSVLAVPALVWVLRLPPQVAVATSLAVVAPAAALGAFSHARAGNVALRTAAWFGAPAIAAAYVSALLGRRIPDQPLLIGFALLATAAALRMLMAWPISSNTSPSPAKAAVAGGAVGSITGLFGVGGGFIVVPALLLALNMSMTKAVGTSLVVVAATATAGLAARASDLQLDPNLIAFALTALLAVMAGSMLSRVTKPARLRKGFAVVLLAVAMGTAAEAFYPSPAAEAAATTINARMVSTDAV